MQNLKRLLSHINHFNYWLMSGLANANASAWTFYLLVFAIIKVWTITPPHTPLDWLQQIVSILYQGAALPLISFVSKLEGDKQAKIINETHDTTLEEFKVLKDMHNDTHVMVQELTEMMKGKL